MKTETEVYHRLQQEIDKTPIGFPATGSGVELRLLKHLFTPEEAETALNLSALPEPAERIYNRARKQKPIAFKELEQILDRLVEKGVIMGGKTLSKGQTRKVYSKLPLAIGMFEFQVDRLTKQFSQDIFQYFDEGFAEEFHSKKTSQMRTIPINQSLKPEHNVGTYDDTRQIVMKSVGPFAVINCVCRQANDLLGKACKQTDIRETCIVMQDFAQNAIDGGNGRALTKDETLALLDRAESAGMVLQPQNSQDPLFVCCCCGCCCGVLTSAKKLPQPAQYFHTNYFSEVDPALCEGCKTCISRCKMEAISMVDKIASVDLDQCIGCGLCVTTCKASARQLKKKGKETVPPKDQDSLYKKIMMEKLGPWGSVKMMGKMLLRKKI